MEPTLIKPLRRRLCLALPLAVLTGTFSAAAQAHRWPLSGAEASRRHFSFEVALKLDMFGETIEPVVQVHNAQRTTLRGVHDDIPWSMEFTIARFYRSDKLRVTSVLTRGGEVLAAPVRTAVVGQRVVVRSDDDVYAAMVIKGL